MSSTNKENIGLSKELKKAMKVMSKIQNTLDTKKQKASKLNTRNINKWLRSRDQKIKILQERISRKDKELEELKKEKMSFPKLYNKKQLRMLHIQVRFGIGKG